MRRSVVAFLIGTALVWTVVVVTVMALGHRAIESDATRGGAVGIAPNHMLISGHNRRQPAWQLTWNAPDGATGYKVYVAHKCPALICKAPTCTISEDGGPDGSPIVVGACSNCAGSSTASLDAGTCTCLNDGGRPTCNNGPITGAQIDAGQCSNPALCCVTYPGAPAPAGQHDGIVVSQCYATATPDGGPIQTDAGRCCVHGSCWYPYPNFPIDGGIGTRGDAAQYSGTCWMQFYVENGYYFDVEAH